MNGFTLRQTKRLIFSFGHTSVPRIAPQERCGLRSHAEHGNDENIAKRGVFTLRAPGSSYSAHVHVDVVGKKGLIRDKYPLFC